jgi:hypothetical protein
MGINSVGSPHDLMTSDGNIITGISFLLFDAIHSSIGSFNAGSKVSTQAANFDLLVSVVDILIV